MSGRLLGKGFRYRTAAETQHPGYLRRRFEAIKRLQRLKSRGANVQPIRKVSSGK